VTQAIYNKKNDLLSAVASNDIIDRVKHLVKYLSCRVFGQAMYRHIINIVKISRNFNRQLKLSN